MAWAKKNIFKSLLSFCGSTWGFEKLFVPPHSSCNDIHQNEQMRSITVLESHNALPSAELEFSETKQFSETVRWPERKRVGIPPERKSLQKVDTSQQQSDLITDSQPFYSLYVKLQCLFISFLVWVHLSNSLGESWVLLAGYNTRGPNEGNTCKFSVDGRIKKNDRWCREVEPSDKCSAPSGIKPQTSLHDRHSNNTNL